jgi:hypothetical protein
MSSIMVPVLPTLPLKNSSNKKTIHKMGINTTIIANNVIIVITSY